MQLIDELKTLLSEDLPGESAHRRFSPELSYGRQFAPRDFVTRDAAVAVLLYQVDRRWCFPLTLRSERLAYHAGQVSLPGGAVDGGESSQTAALRELQEELGIATDELRIIGRLTPVNVFVSNFTVTPWLTVATKQPVFRPNPAEVSDVLEVDLSSICDGRHESSRVILRNRVEFSAPCLRWQSHGIWGCTAMILGELIAVVRATPFMRSPVMRT